MAICEYGLHFCENPFDVFGYYPPSNSRYAEVESSGETQNHNEDTKICTTHLKIKGELSLHAYIKAGIDFIFSRTTLIKENINTEKNKQASNSGERGAASNSGYSGAAFTNGLYSSAETDAPKSIAVAIGYKNKAKGNKGSWIVLAERNDKEEILDVQAKLVDGKEIKEHTFYQLIKGKFEEVK
jgi:hypothetical protein